MAEEYSNPNGPHEPPDDAAPVRDIWMRGLWMLVLAILFELGKTVLAVIAVIQFIWMLINKERNQPIADFGIELAEWQGEVTRFLTGASDDKPFPFAPWKQPGS